MHRIAKLVEQVVQLHVPRRGTGVHHVMEKDRIKRATTIMEKKSEVKTGKREAEVDGSGVDSASREIDARIEALGDWRGEVLARVRAVIHAAVPDVVEEIKWRKPSSPGGVPVWSHDGILCTGETYKDKVKFTFPKGAALADPARLFNASLDGNARRAIDIHEGDKIDAKALKALLRAAATLNTAARIAKR